MKAGMLLLVVLMSSQVHAKEATGLSIKQAERQQQDHHQRVLAALPENETISFYDNDWLRLRRRKRTAVADIEVKMIKSEAASDTVAGTPNKHPGRAKRLSTL